ncbi:ribonuclease H-like domain-containing protein [Tanacetum coccineum]
MYYPSPHSSLLMKNLVEITCCAKATEDEAVLWHRRLGHVNFKNINKLVKGNLIKNQLMNEFLARKEIKREEAIQDSQQNGVCRKERIGTPS